jgi:hypothetical protein
MTFEGYNFLFFYYINEIHLSSVVQKNLCLNTANMANTTTLALLLFVGISSSQVKPAANNCYTRCSYISVWSRITQSIVF